MYGKVQLDLGGAECVGIELVYLELCIILLSVFYEPSFPFVPQKYATPPCIMYSRRIYTAYCKLVRVLRW